MLNKGGGGGDGGVKCHKFEQAFIRLSKLVNKYDDDLLLFLSFLCLNLQSLLLLLPAHHIMNMIYQLN